MRTYTTCEGCGEHILNIGPGKPAHAGCESPTTHLERLQREFATAAADGDDEQVGKLETLIEQADNRPPRLLDAALLYTTWGWPVFPLKPGEKTPATRNGFKNATTDQATVRKWWHDMPHANIGVPTGVEFDVVDVDFKHGAARVWPDLRDSTGMPNAHGIATTPGGMHVLLMPTGDGNSAQMGGHAGLDYRGKGGYVVVAPSRIASGGRYQWAAKPSPMVKAGVAA